MHQIIKYKKEIKLEKYFSDLSASHARTIFLLRTRMLALKCNQKSQYGENTICPRCGKGDDNEFHLLYECEANKEKIQINLENIMRTENIDKEELQSVAQIIQEGLLLPAPDCCVPVCYRTAIIPEGALPTKRNET